MPALVGGVPLSPLPSVSGVSVALSSVEPELDGAAVLESDVELAAFSEARWLLHQLNVAATEPPVSAMRALNAVELSAGDVAVADE